MSSMNESCQMDFHPNCLSRQPTPFCHARLLHYVIKLDLLFLLFWLRMAEVTYCASNCSYNILWPTLLYEARFLTDRRWSSWYRVTSTYIFLCMQAYLTVWQAFILHRFSSASFYPVVFCGSSRCCLQGTLEGESHCCEHTALTQGRWHQPRLTSSHCQHFSCPSKVSGWINIV